MAVVTKGGGGFERQNRLDARQFFFDDASYEVYQDFLKSAKQSHKSLTGLWNVKGGKIALMGFTGHRDVGKGKDLLSTDSKSLKEGWFGFTANFGDTDSELKISPMSGEFGKIPIEYHLAFEGTIRRLFGERFKKILYYQFNYERHIPREDLQDASMNHPNLTETPMDNDVLFPDYAKLPKTHELPTDERMPTAKEEEPGPVSKFIRCLLRRN
jgi:hypothetical protein